VHPVNGKPNNVGLRAEAQRNQFVKLAAHGGRDADRHDGGLGASGGGHIDYLQSSLTPIPDVRMGLPAREGHTLVYETGNQFAGRHIDKRPPPLVDGFALWALTGEYLNAVNAIAIGDDTEQIDGRRPRCQPIAKIVSDGGDAPDSPAVVESPFALRAVKAKAAEADTWRSDVHNGAGVVRQVVHVSTSFWLPVCRAVAMHAFAQIRHFVIHLGPKVDIGYKMALVFLTRLVNPDEGVIVNQRICDRGCAPALGSILIRYKIHGLFSRLDTVCLPKSRLVNLHRFLIAAGNLHKPVCRAEVQSLFDKIVTPAIGVAYTVASVDNGIAHNEIAITVCGFVIPKLICPLDRLFHRCVYLGLGQHLSFLSSAFLIAFRDSIVYQVVYNVKGLNLKVFDRYCGVVA
jgi:hypothetical protein